MEDFPSGFWHSASFLIFREGYAAGIAPRQSKDEPCLCPSLIVVIDGRNRHKPLRQHLLVR